MFVHLKVIVLSLIFGIFVIEFLCLFGVSPITQVYQKPVLLTPMTWMQKITYERMSKYERLKGNMELVVRLTLNDRFISRMYCDVLRSSSIFWNSTLLGEFLLILDEADREKAPKFVKGLESIPNIPHKFRVVYEKLPKNVKPFENVARAAGRPLGYAFQLYSSFLMDEYTDKSIIAWIDTDTAFIAPVLPENVMNSKGQLIVKGWNSFGWSHTKRWKIATEEALGVPMVSDFMTYFPMFLYAKTIRNCRNHIMKHINTSTFEEAFVKVASKNFLSSCDVIMTYAYYYEYDSYEWHIDTRYEPLESYNKKYCPSKPLGLHDITPAIHLSAHSAYSVIPLERAICNMNFFNGIALTENCKKIIDKNKLQVFEFEARVTHFDTWCKPGHFNCMAIVEEHYARYRDESRIGLKKYNPGMVRVVEKSFKDSYNVECPKINDIIV